MSPQDQHPDFIQNDNDCGIQGRLGTFDMLFKMMDYDSQGNCFRFLMTV